MDLPGLLFLRASAVAKNCEPALRAGIALVVLIITAAIVATCCSFFGVPCVEAFHSRRFRPTPRLAPYAWLVPLPCRYAGPAAPARARAGLHDLGLGETHH